ncbi:MAG: PAS domain S-box protein [Dehalococcoidales bacterium]|nr:PAS domain S-box protein [Dehalococcoidales bacterium]
MKRLAVELRKPLFWLILFCFLGGVLLHYSEYIFSSQTSVNTFLGLQRHSIERLLFLTIVILADVLYGFGIAMAYLIAAILVMIPRFFLSTPYLADSIYETLAVLLAGIGFNWWFESHRREVGRREQSLLKLDSIRQELESHIETIRENEKRLSVLHSITTAINEFGSLAEILNIAAEKILEVVAADGVLIYLINRSTRVLELKQFRGVSQEFASGVDRLEIGEGFNGWVVQSGKPAFIEDSASDPRLSREVVKKERIGSQFIVPLMAREEVIGTLCILSHSKKKFTMEEEQLLILIGSELGVAMERASLSEEKERVGRRYRELFVRAHDAIWMQDLEGRILAANQAAADLTGYGGEEALGTNVTRFLAPGALELAREVRRKLMSGIEVEQPYEQRVIRKDGTEAIIMLTTSIIMDENGKPIFQHISRDVTRERRLAENLRLYARQITHAHEEERKRIARELHDDSIQALSILSRRVDELISAQSRRSKIIKPLEEVRAEIDNVLARIRLFAQDLRPPTLDYLGLIPAVRELLTQVGQQTGIQADLRIEGEGRHFMPEDELLIYRIIQEALRNVWRHASAKQVHVAIRFNARSATVDVTDDGNGFVIGEDLRFVQAGKIGLAGMQERADLLGGTLSIQSKPGQGTTVNLVVPGERWKTKA